MSLDRRQFLTRTGAAAVGAAGALGAPGIADASDEDGERPRPRPPPIRFWPTAPCRKPSSATRRHGSRRSPSTVAIRPGSPTRRRPPHASRSSTPPPDTRGALISTLQTLTQRARFLTHGGVPADLGTVAPPSDSGTLGPDIPPDGLTVTVGLGASLFENPAFGLADKKPKRLTEMTSFPNDNLQPDITGGDILLQICAGQPDTAIHALRDIAKHTRAGMQIAYRMDGFQAPQRPDRGAAEPLRPHGRDRQSERGGPIRRRPAAVGHRQDG